MTCTTHAGTDVPATEIDRLGAALAAAHAALETAHAALKTAEARERSRLADDLHDILGHALQVVAFKAELAARLLETDCNRAHGEMVEIQRVARSAMNDVRSLARCRRPTDLDAELTGAVSLFQSAGIEVVVNGDVCSVARRARDPLARVLREAVTNVLRHADPTRCLITVEQNAVDASVAVVNDGVGGTARMRAPGGTGLAGLSRLLEEHQGRLSAGHNGSGYFTLRGTVATPAGTSDQFGPAHRPHPSRSRARRHAVPR